MHELSNARVPILGFAAFSGTGKTTLLKHLIPILAGQSVRIGLIKHSHHSFDIDFPGKDSYELRKAGASPVMVTSSRRRAIITERQESLDPDLNAELAYFDQSRVDLILVEGFKNARYPKIELHRQSLGHPYMFREDPTIIALALEGPRPAGSESLPVFNLSDAAAIAEFIMHACHLAAR